MDGVQWVILVLSAGAVWLIGLRDIRVSRWGYVVGLVSQPFWLVATFRAEQWGMFALSIWYLFSWINGIRNRFPLPFGSRWRDRL